MTVLVVDDDASLRLLCRINLELEGYRVLEASTVQAAREALAREAVAVILLDVDVGGESGLVLLDELGPERRPRVAFFTGTAQLDDEIRALADGVIPKPFALDDFLGTVARLAARVP
jgi:DNA-binding response OmpR family regulator